MRTFIPWSLIFLLILCSCSDDLQFHQQQLYGKSESKYKISPEHALSISQYYLNQIEINTTRTQKREVQEITPVYCSNPLTKSSDTPDTLLYVINYKDDGGFAIVSADSRATPIYAISDDGHFCINDETPYPIKSFFASIQKDVENSINTYVPTDPIIDTLPNIITPTIPNLYDNIGPLISKHQSRIGPSKEFCKYVINDKGESALTCCVPIAIEIAMSYHKWPEILENQHFDWDAMNKGNDDDGIARMLAILSSSGYTAVYGNTMENIGKANMSTVIPTLIKLRYIIPVGNESFQSLNYRDDSKIKSILRNYGPILIDGRAAWDQQAGHLWVLDGRRETFSSQPDENKLFKKLSFYHFVWGTSGECNGYYLTGVQKMADGVPDFHDSYVDTGDDSNEHWRRFGQLSYFGSFQPL